MISKIIGVTRNTRFFKLKVSVLAVLIIISSTITAFATSAIVATDVTYLGETQRIVSFSQDAQEIIAKTDFPITEYDVVNLDKFDVDDPYSTIEIIKAYQITIEDDAVEQESFMFAGTVAEALSKASITLKSGDEVNYTLETFIDKDMKIEIKRAFGVTLVCDGKSYSYDVSGGTVQDLLDSSNVKLGEDDMISHKLSTELKEETVVTIKRVTFKQIEKTEEIDFDTKTEQTSSLYKGETEVKQEGKVGEKTRYYKETYVDGKLTDTELVKSEVTKEPVDKIILSGTKEKVVVTNPAPTQAVVSGTKTISELTPPSTLELDENGRPTQYKKKISGPATAYSSGSITSTGASTMPGLVAVDPSEIPYGTKMYIVSSDGKYNYGYSVASDTGGFIHNSNTVVDLFFHSYADCTNFGRRNVDIYIL